MTLRPRDCLGSGVDSGQLLAPTRLRGIVKTAPWQVVSDALLIATLLVSVKVWVVPAGTTSEPARS